MQQIGVLHGQKRLKKMGELQEPRASIEELISVLIVQQQRIYDVLLLILSQQDEEHAKRLIQTHENMDNIGPAPFLMEE